MNANSEKQQVNLLMKIFGHQISRETFISIIENIINDIKTIQKNKIRTSEELDSGLFVLRQETVFAINSGNSLPSFLQNIAQISSDKKPVTQEIGETVEYLCGILDTNTIDSQYNVMNSLCVELETLRDKYNTAYEPRVYLPL